MFCLHFSCVPVEKDSNIELDTYSYNEDISKIIYFQAQRNADSLIQYLTAENPNLRYHAAKAFGSFSDEKASEYLINLLDDPEEEIRSMAAFALGQTRESDYVTSLIQAFDNHDSLRNNRKFNSVILEAIGKTGGEDEMFLLSTISNYRPYDTLLLIGQMRGLLEFTDRGMMNDKTYQTLINIAGNPLYSNSIKKYANYILARQDQYTIDSSFFQLNRAYHATKDQELKKQIVRSLNSCSRNACMEFYYTIIGEENNQQLRIAALDNLVVKESDEKLRTFLRKKLEDENMQIQKIAASYYVENGITQNAEEYAKWAEQTPGIKSPAKALLFKASLRHLPYYFAVTKASLINKVKAHFAKTNNPYKKLYFLSALSEDVSTYEWIIDNCLKSEQAVLRSGASRELLEILDSEFLDKVYRNKTSKVKNEIKRALIDEIKALDAGVISEICQYLLRNGSVNADLKKEIIKVKNELLTAENYEAYLFTVKLSGKDNPEDSPAVLFPIDSFKNYADTDSLYVKVETDKGSIKLLLFPKIAPYSVSSFIHLAKDGYYDKMPFHRVVPNFVIQTGCSRGDGYGSLNYYIPTETGRLYYDKPGMLGMASAGRDTESSQWFITSSITPHLNGDYTIFGEVDSGMEVVRDIQEGDLINTIEIFEK